MAEQLPIVCYVAERDGLPKFGAGWMFSKIKTGPATLALTPHAPAQSALDELRDENAALKEKLQEQALQALSDDGQWIEHSGTLAADRDELRREVECLKTVMIAAAEEIHGHWDAHCDQEGYGPANLMRRLEQGIPSEYGYTAGAFESLRREVEALRADRDRLDWLESQHKATVEIFSFERWKADEVRYVRCWVIDKAPADDSLRAAIDTARASTDEGVGK